MAAAQEATTSPGQLPPRWIALPYVVFVASAVAATLAVDMSPSVFLTLAGMAQALGLSLLYCGSRSCLASYSPQSLGLVVASLSLQLSSTSWASGYLPADATGDWLYQAVDAFSLVAALRLWLRVSKHRQEGCCKEIAPELLEPTLEISRRLKLGVPAALVLAALLHGDLNSCPVLDTLWLAGHFLGTAASFPQLWLSSSDVGNWSAAAAGGPREAGAEAEARLGHFISSMALSQLLTVIYMWLAREDVTCQPWIDGFNHTIWSILAASGLHLLLVTDGFPALPSL